LDLYDGRNRNNSHEHREVSGVWSIRWLFSNHNNTRSCGTVLCLLPEVRRTMAVKTEPLNMKAVPNLNADTIRVEIWEDGITPAKLLFETTVNPRQANAWSWCLRMACDGLRKRQVARSET
jgi:hypothetical protein